MCTCHSSCAAKKRDQFEILDRCTCTCISANIVHVFSNAILSSLSYIYMLTGLDFFVKFINHTKILIKVKVNTYTKT